ncbi:MAG: hypothetical protein KA133_10435 [Flavobacterium sp.]|nr:hypothetical protein [Flavobacterium sp.]
MKTKEYRLSRFFSVAPLLWMFFATAQNNTTVTDPLVEKLQSLPQNNVSDLVYLQTSKTIYETEEDLWFKGYVLDSQYFYPSASSKTLFVQLIEEKTDQVVWEKKYEIENGFVDGHLFLKSELTEGIYTLAAYSSHSVDGNAKEFYAAKKLEILKTISLKTIVAPIEKDSVVLFTTFPESGKLVSGIESTLAFKAVNSKGLPVAVSGNLFENGINLFPFKSSHAGMGGFDFTPDSNKKYHIQLTEPASEKIYDIAPIAYSGKGLHFMGTTKDLAYFKIKQSDNLKEERIYLRLQIRGVVYSIATGLLKKELIIKIPLKDLPQGIAEVTLFDKNAIPLAERLVYVNQDQKLIIKTELNKSGFTTRDKANLKIKVTDENGQPIVAHLGLSVYDGLYQNKQDSKNIESHYYLSTQLKGNIYDPAYYFNEKNKDRKQALNLLLLTQGWRNYVWNEDNVKEQGNNNPIVFDEIKGKVRLEKPNKKATVAIGNKIIAVSSPDESKGNDFITTDTTGVFTAGPNELKKGEGGYVYLRLMTEPKPKYRMAINDFSFEVINKERKIKTALYPLPTLLERKTEVLPTFVDRPGITKLKEVLITSKKKMVFRDKYIGKLDSLAKLNSDYVCSYNILNCPNHGGEFNNKKPVEGEIYSMPGGTTAGPYHYPNYTEAELLEMFNIAMIEGYYGRKVFYEAVYDEVTITDSLQDFRNTLFWKSDVITNEQGEASVDFFCSDINSLFIGNIEGVSGDGL